MTRLSVDGERLLQRLQALGETGVSPSGKLTRLAASDEDRLGRDAFAAWAHAAGLDVRVDRIGNMFAVWETETNRSQDPILMGSHIDTVIDAGRFDGCYGVLAGLSVIEALKVAGVRTGCPIAVAAFTNEEGVRYAPDMMGSLVFVGGLDVVEALNAVGTDGTLLGAELARIGYLGEGEPGSWRPQAYLELHIEQGPVLETERTPIGAVGDIQGLWWAKVVIDGTANHAGTTPMGHRRDAGVCAARIVTFLHERASRTDSELVATVGCIDVEPNAINVIPGKVTLTVDLRSPSAHRLAEEERVLRKFLDTLSTAGFGISTTQLARTEPTRFDQDLVEIVAEAALERGLKSRRMVSGAGHDAQMLARICPTAMIFVPSVNGISHNPLESTNPDDLIAGANVLLDVVTRLARE